MQIILLERIEKLGQMGDLVNVKTGYARNFLIPQGKALRATKANTERFQAERAQREANNLELRKDAETGSWQDEEPCCQHGARCLRNGSAFWFSHITRHC